MSSLADAFLHDFESGDEEEEEKEKRPPSASVGANASSLGPADANKSKKGPR